MDGMRVDHVSYAAEHDGARATADRLGKLIGVDPVDGGVHPRFGTRNIIFPLAHERYVEVVECLDHPASDKAPFGQAVKARSEAGGGWLGWVVRVADIHEVEDRVGRASVEGNRHRPDGVELRWRQLGVKGLISDPQLPYYVEWERRGPAPQRRRVHHRHDRRAADRRRPRAGGPVARPARRHDVVGHRLHLRGAARHARAAERHLRHPRGPRHRLTALAKPPGLTQRRGT